MLKKIKLGFVIIFTINLFIAVFSGLRVVYIAFHAHSSDAQSYHFKSYTDMSSLKQNLKPHLSMNAYDF